MTIARSSARILPLLRSCNVTECIVKPLSWRPVKSSVSTSRIPHSLCSTYRCFTTNTYLYEEVKSVERIEDEEEQIRHVKFDKTYPEVWAEFCQRIEQHEPLTPHDFVGMATMIKWEDQPHAVRRFQLLLREMNKRTDMDEAFVRICNMLLHIYIRRNDLKSATLVYEGMVKSEVKPNEVTICTLLDGIAKLGTGKDMLQFYETLANREGLPDSTKVYSKFMSIFAERGDIERCRAFFEAMVEKGIADEGSYTFMLITYGQAQQPESAYALYKKMLESGPKPSLSSYHTVLDTLRRHKKKTEMQKVYEDLLQSGLEVNSSHYAAMGWDPKRTLKEMRNLGVAPSTRDYNSFLSYYVRQNKFAEALEMFQAMQSEKIEPDVYSYGILIDAVAKDKDQPSAAAFDLYYDMQNHGVAPDVVIYTTLMMACSREQNLEDAMKLLEDMQQNGVRPNIYTFNSLLALLARKKHKDITDLERAEMLWRKMAKLGIQPDTRSHNVYLSLLAKFTNDHKTDNGQRDTQLDEKPKKTPLTKMLDLYKHMRAAPRFRKYRPDFISYGIVIRTLVRCNQTRKALLMYDDAKAARIKLTTASYNELMRGLTQEKEMSQVMNVWHDMKALKVLPDHQSYALALGACQHLGLEKSFESIRAQRQADFDRLFQLDQQAYERSHNSFLEQSLEETIEEMQMKLEKID
ncbi:hypothetical protein EC973_005715 [Apophysomyces ossiformis]|uniref:Pentacotripeptide-repeat region of PRORP domain-containing protein n=1 Tax=Apophysomyces ossiformis TaxID=679940 RepID=A0A8H7BZ80_9FUNG|nr:hypothetical protein EC973_005715 [Apophysomyces ossiformis]